MKFGTVCLVLALVGCQRIAAISDGSKTTIEKHPYQVAIDVVGYDEENDEDTVEMVCSGALLTQRTVITVASCLSQDSEQTVKVDNVRVRVGSQFREEGGETYRVVGYAPYDDSDTNVLLLYLDSEVPLRKAVQTVPMVDPSVGFEVGETVIMTGFGDTRGDKIDEEGQLDLQAAALQIFTLSTCNLVYENTFTDYGPRGCAGGMHVGFCGKRDNGSPLVNWLGQLVGVSFMVRDDVCGKPGFPTVFVNLADATLQAWVRKNVDKV